VKNSLIASTLKVGGGCVRPKNCQCQWRMVAKSLSEGSSSCACLP
jgi:hypothetical protein